MIYSYLRDMNTEIRSSLSTHGWFGDKRLSERFGKIVEDLGTHIGQIELIFIFFLIAIIAGVVHTFYKFRKC